MAETVTAMDTADPPKDDPRTPRDPPRHLRNLQETPGIARVLCRLLAVLVWSPAVLGAEPRCWACPWAVLRGSLRDSGVPLAIPMVPWRFLRCLGGSLGVRGSSLGGSEVSVAVTVSAINHFVSIPCFLYMFLWSLRSYESHGRTVGPGSGHPLKIQ